MKEIVIENLLIKLISKFIINQVIFKKSYFIQNISFYVIEIVTKKTSIH